jgi:hypothetical protein
MSMLVSLFEQSSHVSIDPIVISNCSDEYLHRLKYYDHFDQFITLNDTIIILSYNLDSSYKRDELYEDMIYIAINSGCVINAFSIQYIPDYIDQLNYTSYQVIHNNIYAEFIIYDNGNISFKINKENIPCTEYKVYHYGIKDMYSFIVSEIQSNLENNDLDNTIGYMMSNINIS